MIRTILPPCKTGQESDSVFSNAANNTWHILARLLFLRAMLRISTLGPVRNYLFCRPIPDTTLTNSPALVTSGNPGLTATMPKHRAIRKLADNRYSLNLPVTRFLPIPAVGIR